MNKYPDQLIRNNIPEGRHAIVPQQLKSIDKALGALHALIEVRGRVRKFVTVAFHHNLKRRVEEALTLTMSVVREQFDSSLKIVSFNRERTTAHSSSMPLISEARRAV